MNLFLLPSKRPKFRDNQGGVSGTPLFGAKPGIWNQIDDQIKVSRFYKKNKKSSNKSLCNVSQKKIKTKNPQIKISQKKTPNNPLILSFWTIAAMLDDHKKKTAREGVNGKDYDGLLY